MFEPTGFQTARSAMETINLQFDQSTLQLLNTSTIYPGLAGIDLQSLSAAFTPIDLQRDYLALAGIDSQIGLPRPDFYCGAALPSAASVEVSGAYLKSTIVELKSLRNTQRALDTTIESMEKRWASFCKDLEVSTAFFQTVIIEKLHCQLVRRWARTKTRILTLSRRIKAIKRAMRQRQRAVFVGLTETKKAWYLLHGAHPPEAQFLRAELLFGGVRS